MYEKTFQKCVIASQCSHWRGNLKMQGCTLDNPKAPFRPKYYLLFMVPNIL